TVTPLYFETMAIPVRRGRDFAAGDVQTAEPVAIVSESFAERFLGGDGLGRMVTVGGRSPAPRRVVAVVGDTTQFIAAPVSPTDAQVPLGRVRTMEEILSASLAFQRFLMLLLVVFAALAVALAAVGIYGVMSYLVTQSTREIGVRIALGALPRQVLGVVIGRGMLLAGIGVAVGLAGALVLTRLLSSQLYGVKPTDVLTFAAVTALLLRVALAACFVPARRATRVDPVVALRSE